MVVLALSQSSSFVAQMGENRFRSDRGQSPIPPLIASGREARLPDCVRDRHPEGRDAVRRLGERKRVEPGPAWPGHVLFLHLVPCPEVCQGK